MVLFISAPPIERFRGALAIAALVAPTTLSAQNYDFLAAPEIELNIVYRLDTVTGEIGACQYGDKEGTVGVTLCYPSGQGAKAQAPSAYKLVSSRHEREGGVFRVNHRTGEMSVCYVFEEKVVCTPPELISAVTTQTSSVPETTGSIKD